MTTREDHITKLQQHLAEARAALVQAKVDAQRAASMGIHCRRNPAVDEWTEMVEILTGQLEALGANASEPVPATQFEWRHDLDQSVWANTESGQAYIDNSPEFAGRKGRS